jgi:hypothetical protein
MDVIFRKRRLLRVISVAFLPCSYISVIEVRDRGRTSALLYSTCPDSETEQETWTVCYPLVYKLLFRE